MKQYAKFFTNLCGVSVLMICHLASADPKPQQGEYSQSAVIEQRAFEALFLMELEAEEILSGEAYTLFAEVAEVFNKPTPHLYVSPKSFLNSWYIMGSIFPESTRTGIIVVSQDLVELLNPLEQKGAFAHEIAHLANDPGDRNYKNLAAEKKKPRNLQEEIEADHHAALRVGYKPLYAFLNFFESASASSDGVLKNIRPIERALIQHEIPKRIAALKKYEAESSNSSDSPR